MSLARAQKLGLYKQMLRHARIFPSMKRDSIVAQVRRDWRSNVRIQDDQVEKELQEAQAALEQLMEFTSPKMSDRVVNIDVGGMKYARRGMVPGPAGSMSRQ